MAQPPGLCLSDQGAQGAAVNQVVSLAQFTGVSEGSLPPLLAIQSWLL